MGWLVQKQKFPGFALLSSFLVASEAMSGRNDPSAEDSSCSCWAAALREGCVTREPFPERCKSVGCDFFLL